MSRPYSMKDTGELIVPDSADSEQAKQLLDFIAREGASAVPRLVSESGQEVIEANSPMRSDLVKRNLTCVEEPYEVGAGDIENICRLGAC